MRRWSDSLLKSGARFLCAALFVCSFAKAGTQNASEELRDPFWPVGYVPEISAASTAAEAVDTREEATASKDADWDSALEKVQMAGVSRKGNTTVVIVNGQVRQMGSHVTVVYEGRKYTWRIDSVDKQGLLMLKRVGLQ